MYNDPNQAHWRANQALPAGTSGNVGNRRFSPSPVPNSIPIAGAWLKLSQEQRLRLLMKLSYLNTSYQRDTQTRQSQMVAQTPMEIRCQERLRARAKLSTLQTRRAQFQGLPEAISPPPQLLPLGVRRVRRISSARDSLPFPSRTVSTTPKQRNIVEDDSTICMPVSLPTDAQDMLQEQDFDHIFDDCSCVSDNEERLVSDTVPVHYTDVSNNQPSFLVTIPRSDRQVSEMSPSLHRDHVFFPSRPVPTKVRSLTPKEAGSSTWDDVSSIGTTSSRLAYLEPEPLPMGDCPIPSVIFVPQSGNTSTGTATTTTVIFDDLEPLHVFPPTHNCRHG